MISFAEENFMGEQLKLEFEPVVINNKDILLVESRDEPYCFINEIGFVTQNVPEGAKVRTEALAIVIGTAMPEITGIIHYYDGVACLRPISLWGEIQMSKYQLLRLWRGDVITVLNTPEPSSQA